MADKTTEKVMTIMPFTKLIHQQRKNFLSIKQVRSIKALSLIPSTSYVTGKYSTHQYKIVSIQSCQVMYYKKFVTNCLPVVNNKQQIYERKEIMIKNNLVYYH